MFHLCLISITVLGALAVIFSIMGASTGFDIGSKLSNDTIAAYSQGVRITSFAMALYDKPFLVDLKVVKGKCPEETISLTNATWPGTLNECNEDTQKDYPEICDTRKGTFAVIRKE